MGTNLFRALQNSRIDPLTGQTRVDPIDLMGSLQTGPVRNIGEGLAQGAGNLIRAIMMKGQMEKRDEARKTAAEKLALALMPDAPQQSVETTDMGIAGDPGLPPEMLQAASRQALVEALMNNPGMAAAAQQYTAYQGLPEEVRNSPFARQIFGMQDPEAFEIVTGEEVESLGFPAGSVLQRNRSTGQVSVLRKPESPNLPASAEEYEYAKRNGYTGSFADFKRDFGGGSQEKFGNSPIWGTDAEGNPVLMQPSSAGGVKVVQLPEGITPQRGQTSRVDLGDKVGILDANGNFIGYAPKGIAPDRTVQDGRVINMPAVPGEGVPSAAPPAAVTSEALVPPQAAQPAQAAPAAPTVQELPPTPEQRRQAEKAVMEAERSIALVEELINHPGLPDVVGMPESLSGAFVAAGGKPIPGTRAADFMARLEQIGGKQFLEAFESLKGGGQITQTEGDKATKAMSRLMQTGQTEEEYKKAARELIEVLRAGMDRARKGAGAAGSDMPQPAQPLEFDFVPGKGLVPRNR